jgi:hypothetical protein
MRITSELICQAADQLHGFVGLNRKTGQYIVRFSEDAFGMDVADDGIIPTAVRLGTGCRPQHDPVPSAHSVAARTKH